jgi:hypothetical protein
MLLPVAWRVLAMILDEQLHRGAERRSGPRRRDQRDARLFKVD